MCGRLKLWLSVFVWLSFQFFQKNGTPYPISKSDNVLVEIVHQNAKVATTTEFGSDEPSDANLARVSFAVHRSGEYVISVMIGGRHIKGSPFSKTFEPGDFCLFGVALNSVPDFSIWYSSLEWGSQKRIPIAS